MFGPVNFSFFFKELYKYKLKNLIRTSKFKCLFRGLHLIGCITQNIQIHHNSLHFHQFAQLSTKIMTSGTLLTRILTSSMSLPIFVNRRLLDWSILLYISCWTKYSECLGSRVDWLLTSHCRDLLPATKFALMIFFLLSMCYPLIVTLIVKK